MAVAAILLCLVALQSGCGGAEARKLKYMERGQSYLAQGNYEKARIELRNVLQIEPDNALALYLSGEVAEKLNDYRTAAGMYQAAIDADPNHRAAIARLAKLFLFAGAADRALQLVEPALAKGEDSQLLTVRGAARIQSGDAEGGLSDARRAVEVDPDNSDAIALLAATYRRSAKNDEALTLLREAVKRHPDDSALRLVLAQLYVQLEDRGSAETELTELVRLNPKEHKYRYQLAHFYLGQKNVDRAERVLRDAIAVEPDASELKLALSDFLATQRSRQQAERELRAFIAAEPDRAELRMGLGGFYERGGQLEQAEATYRDIIARERKEAPVLAVRNRIAAIKIGQGKLDDAQALLVEVLDENPRDNEALVLRANIAMAQRNAVAAIGDLRAVLRDQPTSSAILRALARAHAQNGDPALAEENLRAAVQYNPGDVDAHIELGAFLAQQGKSEQAITLLAQVANDAPQSMPAREALFRAQVTARQWDDALRTAENIKLLRPDQALGFYFAGLVEEARGTPQASTRQYERALEIQPDGAEALAALVRVLLQQKEPDAALARLQATVERHPQDAVARNLLGEVLLAEKRSAEALSAFEDAIARAPGWWVPYRGTALVQIADGNLHGAIQAYERALKAVAPNDRGRATLWIDLATLYERQQRPEDAIRSYEQLLTLEPHSAVAANNLAMLLVTYRTDESSLDRARDLTAQFSGADGAAFLNTQGWVKYKRGEFDAALPLLAEAVEKVPESPVMRYHLGMAQYRVGRLSDARGNLERALTASNQFTGVAEARATLALLKSKSG